MSDSGNRCLRVEIRHYCILRTNYPDVSLTYLLMVQLSTISLLNLLLETQLLSARYFRLASPIRTSPTLKEVSFITIEMVTGPIRFRRDYFTTPDMGAIFMFPYKRLRRLWMSPNAGIYEKR